MASSSYSILFSLLLLLLLSLTISSATPLVDCGACTGPPKTTPTLPPIIGKPPLLPPVIPVLPPVVPVLPPVIPILPPIIGKPPLLPPVIPVLPPVIKPPGVVPTPPLPPGEPPKKPCPTPSPPKKKKPKKTCPIDTIKLGGCVDLLGGVVSIVLGDPVTSKCCPLVGGLTDLEAALCLCTTIKWKMLNLNVVLPVALELLVTCGKTPPPGFTCP